MTYAGLKAAGVAVLGWGQFLTVVINFVILAFVIFLIVRSANKMKRKAEDAAPAPDPEEIQLLREIRDSLKK
jgi:large conductance mechanosensitive channel